MPALLLSLDELPSGIVSCLMKLHVVLFHLPLVDLGISSKVFLEIVFYLAPIVVGECLRLALFVCEVPVMITVHLFVSPNFFVLLFLAKGPYSPLCFVGGIIIFLVFLTWH